MYIKFIYIDVCVCSVCMCVCINLGFALGRKAADALALPNS